MCFPIQVESKRLSRLPLALWQQAFDGYALAAQAVGQLEFGNAMAHKAIVQELACAAAAEGRKHPLGVIYDELARCVVRVARVRSFPSSLIRFSAKSGKTCQGSWVPSSK